MISPLNNTDTALSPSALSQAPSMDALLPLPPGGRPVWGARAYLERIWAHHQRQMHGPALDLWEMLRWCYVFQAWAHVLTKRPEAWLSASRHTNLWFQAPVLWAEDQVHRWERDRPWATPGMGIARELVLHYAQMLDGPTPSDAYQGASAEFVWRPWLTQVPALQMAEMLEQSAQLWWGWIIRELCHCPTAIDEAPWDALGQRWGLSPEQGRLWMRLSQWFKGLHGAQVPLMEQWVREAETSDDVFWGGLGHAMGVLPAEVVGLIGANGPLEARGVLNAGERPRMHQDEWRTWWSKWETSAWEAMHQRLNRMENAPALLSMEAAPSPEVLLRLQEERPKRWSHVLEEFDSTMQALQRADRPMAVLIVGGPEQGKLTWGREVAQAAGYAVGLIRTETWSNEQCNPLSAWRLAEWTWPADCRGLVLIHRPWEGASPMNLGRVEAMLRHRSLSVMLTCSHTHNVPNALLRQFDRIVYLPQASLQARLTCARHGFVEEALALRVARSLRSFGDIQRAAAHCQQANDWSWAVVRRAQRAWDRAQSGKALHDLQMPDGTIPQWEQGGYTHLNDVADRLSQAFLEPERYAAMKATAPRGAVLLGPPGCGKTLFARRLAQRLQIPLLQPNLRLLEDEPTAIRDLFDQARAQAPCVILLDEAERLMLRNSTYVHALLTEIDGVEPLEGVLIIATANTSRGAIHPALVRPGRLHEVHTIGLPYAEDRRAIWQVCLRERPLGFALEEALEALGRAARGMTGADIAEIVRQASCDAVAAQESQLSLPRLLAACDALYWGSPDGTSGGRKEDQWRTAVHEAGHALLAWRHGLEVARITVRPRNGALGMVAWHIPEDVRSRTLLEMYGQVQMALGGLAAERALLGAYGSGGDGDLVAVEQTLFHAFADLGLGSLGPIAAGPSPRWSERRRQRLEHETEAWAAHAFEEAWGWLEQHHAWVHELATDLVQERDLSGPALLTWAQRVHALNEPLPLLPRPCDLPPHLRRLPGRRAEPSVERPVRENRPILHQAPDGPAAGD